MNSITMKKILAFLLGLVMAASGQAQLPKWVIHPTNDTLFVKVDECLIEGFSNGKSTLWTMDGTQLYATDNTILPYKDGIAVIKMNGQPVITGFIDKTGKFTALPNPRIAYDHPYFEDGYILCSDKNKQVFYKVDGSPASFPTVCKAYPFHKGFAPFFTYAQMDRRKDPHYGYFKANGQPMRYVLADNGVTKPIEPRDIDFVSGIGSDGKGVAVIKNKLYLFDAASGMFEPFLYGDDESVKKRHLVLNGNYETYFLNLPADTVAISAKYGKNQFAELKFDKELKPLLFSFDGEDVKFSEEPPAKHVYMSNLTTSGKSGKMGLAMDAVEVLPEQFEQIGTRYGNKAFVKMDGKWGVIEIIPGLDYSLKINKGENIAFRHQKFETQIRLDLPAQISAKEARVDIPREIGCSIDKTSREDKDTESGNFVTYDCVLNIPASLPDTITTLTYEPIDVTYDGISLFRKPINVKAWHLKYYNVDPIDSETSVSGGVLSFTVNINAQRNVGEGDYPFDVKIEADSVFVTQEKLSETRRKFLVSNLQEGYNSLNIYVIEEGCPSSVFPFEIYYTKPVPRKKKKEEVVIRKKDPAVKKHVPRLEL